MPEGQGETVGKETDTHQVSRRGLFAMGMGVGASLAASSSISQAASTAPPGLASVVVSIQNGLISAMASDGTGVALASDASTVINAAIQHASSGGSVFVNAGTYVLSTPLQLPPGVHLFGTGAYASIDFTMLAGTVLTVDQTRFPKDQPMVLMGALSGTANTVFAAEMDHLGLDGAGYAARGVVVAGRNSRLHDLLIVGTTTVGVHITNGPRTEHDSYVAVNFINNVISMRDMPGTTGLLIANTFPHGNPTTDHLIANNRILHCGDYQIKAEPGSAGGSQFIGNHTTIARIGWQMTSNCTICGNYIDSALNASIVITGEAVTITGNHFTPQGGSNSPIIVITGSMTAGVVVTGNTIEKAPPAAAALVSAPARFAKNLVVLGNTGTGVAAPTDFTRNGNYIAGNFFRPS